MNAVRPPASAAPPRAGLGYAMPVSSSMRARPNAMPLVSLQGPICGPVFGGIGLPCGNLSRLVQDCEGPSLGPGKGA